MENWDTMAITGKVGRGPILARGRLDKSRKTTIVFKEKLLTIYLPFFELSNDLPIYFTFFFLIIFELCYLTSLGNTNTFYLNFIISLLKH